MAWHGPHQSGMLASPAHFLHPHAMLDLITSYVYNIYDLTLRIVDSALVCYYSDPRKMAASSTSCVVTNESAEHIEATKEESVPNGKV